VEVETVRPKRAAYFLLFCVFPLAGYGQNQKPPDQRQLEVNWIYGAYVAKDVPLVSLSGPQRWQLYKKQTFTSPGIYLKTFLFTAGDQISDSPREWDQDLGGFGQRLASRHGQFVIQNSLSAAGNAALRYEPRYDVCQCSGFWPRLGHAAMRNFVTYDKSEIARRPQFAMYGAAFGAGAISSFWKPNTTVWTESYRSAITQVGFGTLTNVISEFAPEIFGIFRKQKSTAPPQPAPPHK